MIEYVKFSSDFSAVVLLAVRMFLHWILFLTFKNEEAHILVFSHDDASIIVAYCRHKHHEHDYTITPYCWNEFVLRNFSIAGEFVIFCFETCFVYYHPLISFSSTFNRFKRLNGKKMSLLFLAKCTTLSYMFFMCCIPSRPFGYDQV